MEWRLGPLREWGAASGTPTPGPSLAAAPLGSWTAAPPGIAGSHRQLAGSGQQHSLRPPTCLGVAGGWAPCIQANQSCGGRGPEVGAEADKGPSPQSPGTRGALWDFEQWGGGTRRPTQGLGWGPARLEAGNRVQLSPLHCGGTDGAWGELGPYNGALCVGWAPPPPPAFGPPSLPHSLLAG